MTLIGHGGLDQLVYREDYPTPQPGSCDVIVKVGACGLNNTDINTRTAWYSAAVQEGITDAGAQQGYGDADGRQGSWSRTQLAFPRVQGADVAGTVAAWGREVTGFAIGERVMIDPWLLDPERPSDPECARYFGSEIDGGYAEYTRAPAANVHRINSDCSDAELATFPCAYTTAENLINRTGLEHGETVVVSGASGGVGSAAVQLAALRGARVLAIASAEKAEQLYALGAAVVIDRSAAALDEAISDAAPSGCVDVAVDVVGGAIFGVLIDSLRPGGRYSSSGAIAGPMVEFDLRQLIYKDLQLTGATLVPAGTFERLLRLIEAGRLKPLLAATFPLRELAAAQSLFLEKRHVGSIVVTP